LVEQNIETRTESGIIVTDSLLYRVRPDFIVAVNAGLFSRAIDRSVRYRSYANPERPALDTRVEELSINGELTVRYAVNTSVDAGLSMMLK
ncbi:MAG TPA: hypothetical protein VLA34_02925, partial [Candidatus Krumholzibacterium sp.]|nr:hypothetical protein [Candidatus Krumholzibacterium sp.]